MADTNLNTASDDDLRAMGLPPAMTIDDLRSFLTNEEIALMAEDDDPLISELPDDIKASLTKGATAYDEMHPGLEDEDADAEQDGDQDDADADEDDDDPDADAADDEGDEDDAEGDEDGDQPDADQEDDQPGDDAPQAYDTPDPVLSLKDTSELQAKVDGFDAKLEQLQDEFDDGELSRSEFNAKLKEITTDQAKAAAELERTDESNAKARQDFEQVWYGKVSAVMAARPELVDQTPIAGLPEGVSAYTVFDKSLRYVTSNANHGSFGHLSMQGKIDAAVELAKDYIKQTAGKDLTPVAPAPEAKPAKKSDKPGPRKDRRPDPIPTLANVPAATYNDVQESRWAAIDRMDPVDAEEALARMSSIERAKYLSGN